MLLLLLLLHLSLFLSLWPIFITSRGSRSRFRFIPWLKTISALLLLPAQRSQRVLTQCDAPQEEEDVMQLELYRWFKCDSHQDHHSFHQNSILCAPYPTIFILILTSAVNLIDHREKRRANTFPLQSVESWSVIIYLLVESMGRRWSLQRDQIHGMYRRRRWNKITFPAEGCRLTEQQQSHEQCAKIKLIMEHIVLPHCQRIRSISISNTPHDLPLPLSRSIPRVGASFTNN